MPIDKMIEKAYRLIESRRIEYIGEGMYNVIGEHGTYAAMRRFDGQVSCSCPGFVKKNRCSHSLAIIILSKQSRNRRNRY